MGPSFGEALRFWARLGWISFGGTAGHIAIMHEYLVDRKKWISDERFLHALSHCMLLPGPEAQQLSIYIGWWLHGKKGGIAAGALFVLPSMFILLALSIVYARFGSLPWIAAIFAGLKPAVIALIILALFRVARKALRSPLHAAIAMAAFLAMYVLNISLLIVIGLVLALAIPIARWKPALFRRSPATPAHATDRSPSAGAPFRSALAVLATTLLLGLLPIGALFFFAEDFGFWRGLILFFTKTAFVTVGGSYTVIPYVAQFAVGKAGWLTSLQMADGFALAETTPGPLIIVLAFVGFMASYHHFHGSLAMGALGLLATTFYTFLPCFLFVLAGAPLVEKSHGSPLLEGALGLVSAVVVGAILDLTLFLGLSVLFPAGVAGLRSLDAGALLWIILSLFMTTRFRLNVASLILLSIGFGLARRYCF